MQKWLLKDNSIQHLCDSCCAKNLENLVMLEPWKESDHAKKVKCDQCGKEKNIKYQKKNVK